jgi:hypothetical protein
MKGEFDILHPHSGNQLCFLQDSQTRASCRPLQVTQGENLTLATATPNPPFSTMPPPERVVGTTRTTRGDGGGGRFSPISGGTMEISCWARRHAPVRCPLRQWGGVPGGVSWHHSSSEGGNRLLGTTPWCDGISAAVGGRSIAVGAGDGSAWSFSG